MDCSPKQLTGSWCSNADDLEIDVGCPIPTIEPYKIGSNCFGRSSAINDRRPTEVAQQCFYCTSPSESGGDYLQAAREKLRWVFSFEPETEPSFRGTPEERGTGLARGFCVGFEGGRPGRGRSSCFVSTLRVSRLHAAGAR